MPKLAVSGDALYINRHHGLIEALRTHAWSVDIVPSGDLMQLGQFRALARVRRMVPANVLVDRYMQSRFAGAAGFEVRSRQTERKLDALKSRPDVVLHFFSAFAPFWARRDIPYAMYLDFTMSLVKREWPEWSLLVSDAAYDRWFGCEGEAYKRAAWLFTMSDKTRDSLVRDYGIDESKIVVVRSGGHFRRPFEGDKAFGTRRILFDGSEFERKGGDILMNAFARIRRAYPDACLSIIGTSRDVSQPGVEYLGYIRSRESMERLFLAADLVIAPARCDPFPGFVIEGFNYGVPCVVSRASGISEVVCDGVHGQVVEHGDPAAIAAAAVPLLGDTTALARMSRSVRALVRSRLNWDAIAATMSTYLLGEESAGERSAEVSVGSS